MDSEDQDIIVFETAEGIKFEVKRDEFRKRVEECNLGDISGCGCQYFKCKV